MAATEVSIINEALLLIGQKQPIASRTENSLQARIADAIYDDTLGEVLAAAPWPMARRHALLALLTETRTGWKNVYALPADCVAPRYISNGFREGALSFGVYGVPAGMLPAGYATYAYPEAGGEVPPIPFSLEAALDGNSQVLLTDQDSAELIYTARITNPIAFTDLFRKALKRCLASKFAASLPVKAGLADAWDKRYQETIGEALAAAFRSEREDQQPDAKHISVR